MTTNFRDNKVIDKFFKTGVMLHKYHRIPALMKFLGNIQDKKLLDLGCGNGLITHYMQKAGANTTGVDASLKCIMMAKENFSSIKFHHLSGQNLKNIPSNTFDLVTMLMFLVNIPNKKIFAGIFKECARVLKPNGKLVFDIIHPLSMQNHSDSVWQMRLPAGARYLKSGFKYTTSTPLLDKKTKIKFLNSHWSLEDISQELQKNSFLIEQIYTPKPTKPKGCSQKFYADLCNLPRFLFIKSIIKKK